MDTYICSACGMQTASNFAKCLDCNTSSDENSTPSEDWEDAFRFIEEAELRGDVYNIETIAKAHSCTTVDKVDIVQPVGDEVETQFDDDETRDSDQKHVSDFKTGPDLYGCSECTIRFKRKAALKAHFNAQHRRDESDSESQNSFSSSPVSPVKRKSVLKTKLEHEGDDISFFQCNSCNGLLSSVKSLERHKSSFHKTDSKSVEVGSAEHKKSLSVINRILAHKGNDIFFFECDECKTSFSSMNELRKHKLRVHKTQSQSDKIMPKEEAQKPFQSSILCKFEETLPEEKAQKSSQSLANPGDDPLTSTGEIFEQNGNEINYFLCDVCETYVGKIGDLKQHKFSVHNIETDSPKVAPTFSKGNEFSNHIKCDVCKSVLSSIYALKRHKRLIHTGKKRNLNQTFTCKVCKEKFSLLIALKNHKKEHHKKYDEESEKESKVQLVDRLQQMTYKRNDSRKILAKYAKLAVHKKEHHSKARKEVFKCEICNAILCSFYGLNKHKKNVHTVSNRQALETRSYKCRFCKKKFALFILLTNHQRQDCGRSLAVHQKERQSKARKDVFKCEICNANLCSLYGLNRHKRNVHTVSNRQAPDTDYKCRFCKKRFAFFVLLTNHQRLGSCKKFRGTRKFYGCGICGKRCSTNYNLITHQQSRHKMYSKAMAYNKKELRCEMCQREFTTRANFEKHNLLHMPSDLRPNKCNICTISFLHEANLLKHLEIHTGEKPFQCEYCHETFGLKKMKEDHDRLCKHPNRRTSFSCTVCRRSFPKERFLKIHRRLKHNLGPS